MTYGRSWVPPIEKNEIVPSHPFDAAIEAQSEIDQILFPRQRKTAADRAVSRLIDTTSGLEGIPMEVHTSTWGLQSPGYPDHTHLTKEPVVICGDYQGYESMPDARRWPHKGENISLALGNATIWLADDLPPADQPHRLENTGLTAYAPMKDIYFIRY